MEYSKALRGISRGFRTAINRWYREFSVDKLAYELVKYQARDGWSHRDVLRQVHPKLPYDRQAALRWACGLPTANRIVERPKGSSLAPRVYGPVGDLPEIIQAFEAAKTASIPDLVTLIREYGLTREMIPTTALNSVEVWEALLQKMPLTAMIRSLGKMTSIGLLASLKGNATAMVVERLSNDSALGKSRVHPLTILNALRVYQQGHGDKGSLKWNAVGAIVDALDAAFYASFKNVEPTMKNVMICLDVSGSMAAPIAGTGMSCCEASSALALVTARVEKNCGVYRFNTGLEPIPITPRMRLDDVLRYTRSINGGGTDCALPMVYAAENKLEVDAFCVYTDSETWAGRIHPKQALTKYRSSQNRPGAKQIVCAMEATEFTIADPADPLTLDVVGFDTMTPGAISEFIRG
jgi:60 kDa SS-A/Ro ribonucleoprotein